jgi:hypothetical protein
MTATGWSSDELDRIGALDGLLAGEDPQQLADRLRVSSARLRPDRHGPGRLRRVGPGCPTRLTSQTSSMRRSVVTLP